MKHTLRIAALALASAVNVLPQGTILLNTATGPKPRIVRFGVTVSPADNVWVQVLVSGATSLSGLGADPFQLTLTGANSGLFSKGVLTVDGKPGGSVVDVTIRAWDRDTGPTYEESSFCATTTLKDFVLGGVLDANGITGLPASLLPAFTGLHLTECVPEPGTYALAITGLAVLAWRGRARRS